MMQEIAVISDFNDREDVQAAVGTSHKETGSSGAASLFLLSDNEQTGLVSNV